MNLKAFFSGRVIAIGILGVSVSLAFMLGYFVGRSNGPKAAQVVPPTEIRAVGDVSTIKEQVLVKPLLDNINTSTASNTPVAPIQKPIAEKQSPTAKPVKKAEVKQPIEPIKPVVAQAKPTPQTKPQGATPQNTEKKAGFFVQLGSFKSKPEAETFKKNLAVKGYNNIMITTGPLFKVRMGKYATKQEADVKALSIKKAEGLKDAFVSAD